VLLLSATSILASEAFSPIAYGTKSIGMAGVSIATLHGAESGFENPALLSYLPKNEVSIGITYTNPNRELEDINGTSISEDYDNTYSPYMALSYKINKEFSTGLTLSKIKLQNVVDGYENDIRKTRVIIPLSYGVNNFSFGLSIVAEKEQYRNSSSADEFSSTDYGYMLGIAYKFVEQNVLLAINYKSKIDHKFFNVDHEFNMNTASELGCGVHWKIANSNSAIGIDYKKVYASKIYFSQNNPASSNYFKDQDVYALGYEYDTKEWSVRAGYKYTSFLYNEDLLTVGYPFVSKSHYTIGGSYQFSSNFSGDIALLYAPYKRTLSDGIETTTDYTTLSLGVDYSF
jgi:long-subunit fatty acid transport protein